MITLYNRQELIIPYDMGVQAKVRSILRANRIDHRIAFKNMSSPLKQLGEYKIYVKKADYEAASHLIKELRR